MSILDSLNRFMSGVGCVLCGETATEHDLRNRVSILEERLSAKGAEIAALSEKLGEQMRIAETRLDRIRILEIQAMTAPNAGEPVPTVAEPRTNGGRIRAMTDIELAVFLAGIELEQPESAWRDWLWSGTE